MCAERVQQLQRVGCSAGPTWGQPRGFLTLPASPAPPTLTDRARLCLLLVPARLPEVVLTLAVAAHDLLQVRRLLLGVVPGRSVLVATLAASATATTGQAAAAVDTAASVCTARWRRHPRDRAESCVQVRAPCSWPHACPGCAVFAYGGAAAPIAAHSWLTRPQKKRPHRKAFDAFLRASGAKSPQEEEARLKTPLTRLPS